MHSKSQRAEPSWARRHTAAVAALAAVTSLAVGAAAAKGVVAVNDSSSGPDRAVAVGNLPPPAVVVPDGLPGPGDPEADGDVGKPAAVDTPQVPAAAPDTAETKPKQSPQASSAKPASFVADAADSPPDTDRTESGHAEDDALKLQTDGGEEAERLFEEWISQLECGRAAQGEVPQSVDKWKLSDD